jgi:Protein of unknown function (DUF1592)/Protein of unknown function (DUF1588)/Protein of unknown function (DUF1595)/Protein of unknown function (DUF1585)
MNAGAGTPGSGGSTGNGAQPGNAGQSGNPSSSSTGGAPGSSGGSGAVNPQSGSGGASGTGAGGATAAAACTPLPTITRRLWRLSSQQFSNATRDLLSLSAAPTLVTSTTDGSSPYAFINGADLTVQGPYLFGSLYQTAENVIAQIGPRISGTCTGATCIVSCMASETQSACATRFAQGFAPKAFRRPVDASEITNLMKVYNSACPATSATCAATDFNTGIGLMVEALILAPSFIYRTELGPANLAADPTSHNYPATTLTPYEVASQLGFLFLNSTPDAALLAAAADGSLGTPSGLSTQVSRLLTLAPVKTSLTNVMVNWFSLGELPDKTTKDTALLAALPVASQDQPGIVGELLTSAQQFVTDVLWTNSGKITDLVTSPKVFVNQRLASLFGLTVQGATATQFVSTTWPASQSRIGMLSQPAFLWAISDPTTTSIVHRGKFIHDNIVCQDGLPPPVDLTTTAAQAIIAMGNSEITHSNARLSGPPCSLCHGQMDPYARVLQNFDPIGNYRTVDEVGAPIDPSVTFTASSIPSVAGSPLAPMTVAGPTAFGQALVSTGTLNSCVVQKMASYAIGSLITLANTCELQPLRAQFNQSDQTLSSLFSQIALADFVRARAGGASQ